MTVRCRSALTVCTVDALYPTMWLNACFHASPSDMNAVRCCALYGKLSSVTFVVGLRRKPPSTSQARPDSPACSTGNCSVERRIVLLRALPQRQMSTSFSPSVDVQHHQPNQLLHIFCMLSLTPPHAKQCLSGKHWQ